MSMDQYIRQLEREEPAGAGYTIHLIASAFDTTIYLYVENLNGTIAQYQVYGISGVPGVQLPQWVKKLEPNHVRILKKGGIFFPVKEPNQKLVSRRAFKRGKQKSLFEDNTKKLDITACFTPNLIKKLSMEQLGLMGQNNKHKTIHQIVQDQGAQFPTIHKINKTLFHIVQEVLKPFLYTTFQLSKYTPERIPNPSLTALLYIGCVVTDPEADEDQGEEEEDGETTTYAPTEGTEKIDALCKEMSRRSGGIVIYIPRVTNIEEAYTKFCKKFNLNHPTRPNATPQQLLQYLASVNMMGLSEATKQLPTPTTIAPCKHLANVQPFETLAFAGFISKTDKHLSQTCTNLWDETLAFVQTPQLAADPAGRDQTYLSNMKDTLDQAERYGAGVKVAHSLFKLSYTKGVKVIKAPLPLFPAGFDNCASDADRDYFLKLYTLEDLLIKSTQAIDANGETYEG